jgi:isopentenyl-diphosphate delta-isomerase
MSEEPFETYDEAGMPAGVFPRSVVHRRGLWHRAANVFLFRPDGQLLIQQRQLSKDVCPGAWDVSAAEHLQPGETYEAGAIRGLKEELGIDGVEVEAFGQIARARLDLPALGIRDYEFQQSFRAVYAGPVAPDPAEVRDVRSVDLGTLETEMRTHPDRFTPWFHRRAAALGLFAWAQGA